MATPKPKPTKIKKLEGNPSRRPLPKDEPEPTVPDGVPDPPAHLGGFAKAEWERMAAKLHRLGLLTEIDITEFENFCIASGTVVDAENHIQQDGMVEITKSGNIIQSPWVGIRNTAMRDRHTYLTEFGMTPSSRTKVTAAHPEKKSKFAGLVAMPGGKKS